MPDIYFVRHGQSQANAEHKIAGQLDSPLTQLGIEQAQAEAALIYGGKMTLDLILSSSLSRAIDTAKIIAAKNNYPIEDIVVMDDLREKSAGSYEGGDLEVFFAASEQDQLRAGVESFDDFYARVERANKQIREIATGTTLVVGHAGYYRMAICVRDGLAPRLMIEQEKPDNGKLLEYPLSF